MTIDSFYVSGKLCYFLAQTKLLFILNDYCDLCCINSMSTLLVLNKPYGVHLSFLIAMSKFSFYCSGFCIKRSWLSIKLHLAVLQSFALISEGTFHHYVYIIKR